jgi:hypothetical protein
MGGTAYNKVSEQKYMADIYECATGHLLITHCPSGRPVVDGYMCLHCGEDPSEGFCGRPVDEDGFTEIDARKARDTMLASEKRSKQ